MAHDSSLAVYFADGKLARTLSERLAAAIGRPVSVVDSLPRSGYIPHILVTSTTQCSPVECHGVVEEGTQVIVLAAVPSSFQKGLYEKAGASAYLPMTLDLEPLLEAITSSSLG